jgi:23S rRNA pseudouridine2605 synthase
VRVNGRILRELGTVVDSDDRVTLDAKRVELAATHTYLLLNKPLGVVTTMRDPQRRATIADLVPRTKGLFPVGRLDYDTSGVLLLTDDGELAHRLLHPSSGVEKTYRVTIAGHLAADEKRRVMNGMNLGEFRVAGAKLRVVATRRNHSVIDLTIHEGRNRQVRRMFVGLGHHVIALTRIRFGPLKLGGLPVGHFRSLSAKERAALERHRRPPAERSRTPQ